MWNADPIPDIWFHLGSGWVSRVGPKLSHFPESSPDDSKMQPDWEPLMWLKGSWDSISGWVHESVDFSHIAHTVHTQCENPSQWVLPRSVEAQPAVTEWNTMPVCACSHNIPYHSFFSALIFLLFLFHGHRRLPVIKQIIARIHWCSFLCPSQD